MLLNQWKVQGGTQSEAPLVIADSVMSTRTTRPDTSSKPVNTAGGQKPQPPASNECDQTPPFDDVVLSDRTPQQ